MSRLIFEARRRLPAPEVRKGTITIEAPPSLPRLVPPSLLRRVLPYLIVILIVQAALAVVEAAEAGSDPVFHCHSGLRPDQDCCFC